MTPASEFQCGTQESESEPGPESPQARWQAQALSLPPDPKEVLSFVGAAQAPSGYKILESCPSLETDENMQNLIGTQIRHAWDDKDRQGWFEGRVHERNLKNVRDLARIKATSW